MGISSYHDKAGRKIVIEVRGHFDFQLHQEFRAAYDGIMGVKWYRVDLRHVTFVDSSALGMLLLLRDYAGGDKHAVSIATPSPAALRAIKTTCFEELFDVENNDDPAQPGMATKIELP